MGAALLSLAVAAGAGLAGLLAAFPLPNILAGMLAAAGYSTSACCVTCAGDGKCPWRSRSEWWA